MATILALLLKPF